jgi:hypothetical protein
MRRQSPNVPHWLNSGDEEMSDHIDSESLAYLHIPPWCHTNCKTLFARSKTAVLWSCLWVIGHRGKKIKAALRQSHHANCCSTRTMCAGCFTHGFINFCKLWSSLLWDVQKTDLRAKAPFVSLLSQKMQIQIQIFFLKGFPRRYKALSSNAILPKK